MDQELFIIEVLSAKQNYRESEKRAKRIMFKLLSLVFFSGLLFSSCIVPISPYECSSPFS